MNAFRYSFVLGLEIVDHVTHGRGLVLQRRSVSTSAVCSADNVAPKGNINTVAHGKCTMKASSLRGSSAAFCLSFNEYQKIASATNLLARRPMRRCWK